jgi:succinate dehydrogenase flavin-adding protein (antitoxin of CptAB toxin-antitoxin module)
MTKLNISQAIEGIRSADPLTFEDAFHCILPLVDKYKDQIILAMQRESNTKIRARFIELLGYSTDESLVEIFKKELECGDDEIINWCLFALENNPSHVGKNLAQDFRAKNPRFLS